MKREFDVVVIGSGSAGTSAAMALRAVGRSVAVVDERPFGGTCALRGCDPKKVLVAAARACNAAARYHEIGVFPDAHALGWPSLMQFKRTFTDPVSVQRLQTYEKAGIASIHGRAHFADERSAIVGDDRLFATDFVIASGATDVHVAAGDDRLLTSEAFLEMESLPESLVFVGGGYVAFELAHIAAHSGSHVTMLNDTDRPLHGFDDDVVERLLEATRDTGITVHLETTVESVERTNAGVAVHARTKHGVRTFEARNGVLAAGRVPNLEHLDVEAAGVERSKKGVKVNDYLQSTSNPHVYAAGDCADGGGLPLTPVAGYEGEIVASNISNGNVRKPNFLGLASMVYTIPSLGQIGITEAQAREGGHDVETRHGDMSTWFSTRHLAAKAAYYKVVLEKDTGNVLGATIMGPHAEEQINVLALAMRYGLDVRQTADTPFAYPTGSSDIASLLVR